MTKDITDLIDLYDIGVIYFCEKINTGVDKTFKVNSSSGEFILKVFNNNLNTENYEPSVLKILKQKNLPVSEIIQNKARKYISEFNGIKFHLQKYICGKTYENNAVPEKLLYQSAFYLAKINHALDEIYLPNSKVCDWLFEEKEYHKLIEKHLRFISRIKSELKFNKEYSKILNCMEFRLNIIKNSYSMLSYGIQELSFKNSHGDYSFRQILVKSKKINGIIDFSRSSKVPISWELIRSYTISAEECENAVINFNNFRKYLKVYEDICPITKFDKIYMPHIYILQLFSSMFGLEEYIEGHNYSFLKLFYWRTNLIKFLVENIENFHD